MAKVLVAYYSKSGNTKQMAELVAEGARAAGAEAELVRADEADFGNLGSYDGFALGTPDYFTYMAGQLKIFFDEALAHKQTILNRPAVCFVSHGGGGGAIESVERLAKSIGLKQAADSAVVKGAPTGDAADECRALGRELAEAVN
jgi:NAD(P)H dehydrogenase (quinone)